MIRERVEALERTIDAGGEHKRIKLIAAPNERGHRSSIGLGTGPHAVMPVENLVPIGAVLLFVAWGWYCVGGGLEQQAARTMQDIEAKVAADAVVRYGIAKRNGTKIDACAQAGLVAAAYLQAENEGQHQRWKQTEKADCEAAGVPR